MSPPRLAARHPRVRFGLRIILPTLLAVSLFVITIFALIVPAYERQIFDRKREMTRELTHSALSILVEYEREEHAGVLSREEAQREAITRLRYLRYGEEGKDYFWITDLHPHMVMHPYRSDLEGADLSDFTDPGGKRLFVEMVQAAAPDSEGYVEYVWQWKDDPDRIVRKLSHIRAFEPWGWVIGTGIYLEDARQEIARLTSHLVRVSVGITGVLVLLLLVIVQQSLSIEKNRGRAESALRESRERYRALVEASTEGIALVLDGRIAFANPTLLRMLGYSDGELDGAELGSILEDEEPPPDVRLRHRDSHSIEAIMTVSSIRLGGREGVILAFREVSAVDRADKVREELAVELQVALQFLQEPVRRTVREPLTCSPDAPIRHAADLMRRSGMSAILVTSAPGEAIGIVTDRDMRDRVIAAGLDPELPVHRIMSAPLLSFPESGLACEALLTMYERGVRHLAVHDGSGRLVGLLRDRELAASHRFSPASLTREIRASRSIEEIVELRERVPRLVAALIDSGSPPRSVNRILTSVSDTIHETLIAFALRDLGPPPASFAFLTMGSDGRGEQTLVTDQDNALIWSDVPETERPRAEAYFRELAERVCTGLDRAGYAFCEGGNMASNPRWNRPLSEWIELYRRWMQTPEPQELLEFSIFFDFRAVSGDIELARRLRSHVEEILQSNPPFLLHLARHALELKLPTGTFGRIATDTASGHERAFHLKEAMAPIVHVARLYALRHGIAATNTFERLERLHEAGILRGSSYEEILQVHDLLMRHRLRHQAHLMREGRPPDNYLPAGELTELDRAMLKQASARISLLLKKVSYDFLGSA